MNLRETIESHGYVVVPGILPKSKTDAVVEDVWRHTGARPDDRES